VSHVVATLKDDLEAWRTRSLAGLDVIYVYLDGFTLRVRSAGRVVSVPVRHKHLLALELCGGESFAAWKGLPRRSRGAGPACAGTDDHRR
jgi:transposase-like protein